MYTNTWTRYFPLGDDAFPVMLEELKKAEQYIFLEYFIIAPGVFWDSIVEILQEKHAAGVDVRVIYDDVGSLNTLPMNYARKFEAETGIPCCFFNRFMPIISIRMNNRDHRKFCIIDGHTAFTGGINLADEYINQKPRFGHWKDSAILLKGEAAWSMTVMFLTMWEYIRDGEEDYSRLPPGRPAAGGRRGGPDYVQPYTDNPLDDEPVGETVYLNLISKARRYVYIMTPYLIVSDSVNTALCNAAKAGVDVRIMTPHIPDKPLVFELTRSHYEPLLEAGVQIFEYTPGFVHAKNLVVDDCYAVVGSINMDYRSMFLHFEDGVWLCGAPAVLDVKRDFLDTLAVCQEITLARCRERSMLRRLLRAVLRVFAPSDVIRRPKPRKLCGRRPAGHNTTYGAYAGKGRDDERIPALHRRGLGAPDRRRGDGGPEPGRRVGDGHGPHGRPAGRGEGPGGGLRRPGQVGRHRLPTSGKRLLLRAAAEMEARAAELTDLMIAESGSARYKARGEVMGSAGILRVAAGECRRLHGEVLQPGGPGQMSMAVRSPLGVVLGITPFNYPHHSGHQEAGLRPGRRATPLSSSRPPSPPPPAWPLRRSLTRRACPPACSTWCPAAARSSATCWWTTPGCGWSPSPAPAPWGGPSPSGPPGT